MVVEYGNSITKMFLNPVWPREEYRNRNCKSCGQTYPTPVTEAASIIFQGATMRAGCHSALLTDLYELTMAAAYFDHGFRAKATFELFVRSLPSERNYLIAAGLDQALDFLERVRFLPEEIDFLRNQPMFKHTSDRFFDYLENFRFSGEVWAIQEGTPVFAQEPLVRLTAPIIEAQLVETFLLSTITFQTMIASKAARVVHAAQGRDVVEFGTRRAHGPEAGTLAARAAYIGGCVGTSNVEAGRLFQIPVFGTLAHSFVMAHEDEEEAFQRFQRVFPEHSTLLIDTYDTVAAIDKIIDAGLRPQAVRLDSGDLVELSRNVRRKLDRAGLTKTKIFASGDLDEYVITDLLERGAQLDAFGVGTSLATSKDAPTLGGVYKLVDVYGGQGPTHRVKLSGNKISYPGSKQIFRRKNSEGQYTGDVIVHCSEVPADARPLLACVMRDGKRLEPASPLDWLRERAKQELLSLPAACRRLERPSLYPVEFSPKLKHLLEDCRTRIQTPREKKGP